MSKSLRVLLVDDEAPVREVLKEYLATGGHAVETAIDGAQGLKKFDPVLFDLVIVDRAMPEIPGDKLAKMIKAISPDTPVIMLTGSADLMDLEECSDAVNLILGKPVTLKAMLEGIEKVIKKPDRL